jgi:hypothetical protein
MFEELYGDVPNLFPRRFLPAEGPRPKVPVLDPQEESSLLGKVAGAGLGGLSYVGSVLEKALGKRAIMGALAGKPEELLSVVPFSDTMGLTDERNRVGGRELLRHYGLADREDTWGNFGAGLALDVALDPATYLTLGTGALTHAGKVAQKAGALPGTAAGRVGTTLNQILAHGPPTPALSDALAGSGKTLAQLGDMPLGYSVGVGLPGMTPVTGLGQAGLDAVQFGKNTLAALDRGVRSVPLLHRAKRVLKEQRHDTGSLRAMRPTSDIASGAS